MDIALLIARRTARNAPGNRPGVMQRIAVAAVAISLAVMLVTLAVIMGFKREVARKMTGFSGDVIVTDIRSLRTPDTTPIRRSAHLESLMRATPGFAAAAPYAVRGGVVRTEEAVGEILLKGVGAEYDMTHFGSWLAEGALPRTGDSVRTKELLLSRTLARQLQLAPGDAAELLFIDGETPRRDRFKVAGIYASGMDEMEQAVALTDIRNVQRLAGWEADEVSGYEIRTQSPALAAPYAALLDEALFCDGEDATLNLTATDIRERYPHIFDWLKAHDLNAAIIIGIMLAVAFFNMASALLILVFERTRTIGLLKALGMGDRALRRIFLYRAAFVALRGMAWGNLIGAGLCAAQHFFHLIPLDAEGYLLSEVPVAWGWGWWALLNIGVLTAIVALSVIPAQVISTIKPDETIRYE